MDKEKRLVNLPDGKDWLWGNLRLALMDGAMLSKSLIQFSVGAVFPSCYFSLEQTMVGVMAVKVTSFKRTACCGSRGCCIQCPWPHNKQLSMNVSAGDP